jgi:heptaprenyl diphosphate synthase
MFTDKALVNIFEEDLFTVRDLMKKNLTHRDKGTQYILSKLRTLDGKYIRALLVLIGGSFGSISKERLANLATAVELLHLATLVHDDIVDEAQLRRGNETINKIFGAKAALFTGDYLFSQSYILFSKNASPKSIYSVSRTIKSICTGEINQFFSARSLEAAVKEYLKRINGKCASLFSLSLSIGAYEGEAEESAVRKLQRIGYYTGMAFQIIDDILDLTAMDDELGKPAGNDLRQGIYTLPVIYELQKENNHLIDLIINREFEKALELIRCSEGLEKSREIAHKYTEKALTLIQQLPDTSETAALKQIVEKMLVRRY